jgi:hypothetical protein
LLSQTFLKGFLINSKPDLVYKFAKKVQQKEDTLFTFMLFLRTTPLLPNWFINLSSPIAGIPLVTFFSGTFLGTLWLQLRPHAHELRPRQHWAHIEPNQQLRNQRQANGHSVRAELRCFDPDSYHKRKKARKSINVTIMKKALNSL